MTRIFFRRSGGTWNSMVMRLLPSKMEEKLSIISEGIE